MLLRMIPWMTASFCDGIFPLYGVIAGLGCSASSFISYQQVILGMTIMIYDISVLCRRFSVLPEYSCIVFCNTLVHGSSAVMKLQCSVREHYTRFFKMFTTEMMVFQWVTILEPG